MSKDFSSWDKPLQDLFQRRSKTLEKLDSAGIKTLKQLLWFLPKRVQTIPATSSFKNAISDRPFQGSGTIIKIFKVPNWKKGKSGRFRNHSNLTLLVQDLLSCEQMQLKWFNAYPSLLNKFEINEIITFTGKISLFNGTRQIISPDVKTITGFEKEIQNDQSIEVQYSQIAGINPKYIKRIVDKIPLEIFEKITETLSADILEKRQLLTLKQSFLILHGLISSTEKQREKALHRLIYEEFFQEQIKIFSRRSELKSRKGIKISIDKKMIHSSFKIMPYPLTEDQKKCISEIANDLISHNPMMRLVQGDVGCGKTTIAIISTFFSSQNSFQTAILCPTESLAIQHYNEFSKILNQIDINSKLLTNNTPKEDKQSIQQSLQSGEIHVIIGTHSLLNENIQFKNLGLAIIDEQHKFGVAQRLQLISKTQGVNCLIMTATPIPRSLRLTQYGDLDISTINSMPKNRKGHKTKIIKPHDLQNFFNFLKTRLSMGEQVYIVAPAIEENLSRNVLCVETLYKKFCTIFSEYKIECLHGKMKSEEKTNIFHNFMENNIDILISTSVIEVGIDNHNATIMAIFNPEYFGLSSLHQLRGRVGRGILPGFCFLVVDQTISQEGLKRLKLLENTNDGFKIAEKDLLLRGEGDLFGNNQTGKDSQKMLADINLHEEWLFRAKDDFNELLIKDPLLANSFKQENINDINILATI